MRLLWCFGAMALNAAGALAVRAVITANRSNVPACDAACDAANRAAVTMSASADAMTALLLVAVVYPLVPAAVAAGVAFVGRRWTADEAWSLWWSYLWRQWAVIWLALAVVMAAAVTK